ncbi:hypothetical protein [Snodgrassella sp. CFCC 13594]|uniref:hypothetical protein n=1 Tax=Snodgrassella sp. CFCC 13594 TaxID=1775559 RepID=UPI00082C409A|nr:hypothetical protein [Snodgrassella sp. CFCC 13594]
MLNKTFSALVLQPAHLAGFFVAALPLMRGLSWLVAMIASRCTCKKYPNDGVFSRQNMTVN